MFVCHRCGLEDKDVVGDQPLGTSVLSGLPMSFDYHPDCYEIALAERMEFERSRPGGRVRTFFERRVY